jgi:NhaP-type Na+/H+ or K+/H+ antiporter
VPGSLVGEVLADQGCFPVDQQISSLLQAPPLALGPGFEPISAFSVLVVFLGFVLLAAGRALTLEEETRYSASVVYLGLGLAAAVVIDLLDLGWIDPFEDTRLIEHLTEFALVVALFASGLTINRALRWREWRAVVGLLVLVMPATIAAGAAFGAVAMGLSLGAAVALGGILAPTDPVLAGTVGLGPPGDTRRESDARFNLTAEAALNDGLVSPFVLLGVLIIERDGSGWLGEWIAADFLYALGLALVLGALAGYGFGSFIKWLQPRYVLAPEFDGFLVIGIVLAVYGLSDLLDAYGLVSVFVAGVYFRRYETEHKNNVRLHRSATIAKHFAELGVIVLLGTLVTRGALSEPGLAGWLIAPFLILIVRPLSVLLLLSRSTMSPGERVFLAWFGVKGVAALYYMSFLVAESFLPAGNQRQIFWTVAFAVMLSIAVHGIGATAITRRLLKH